MRVWSKSDTRSEWTADNITSKELKAHTKGVEVVAVDRSRDEEVELVSGGYNKVLNVWRRNCNDIEQRDWVVHESLSGHKDWICCLAINKEGTVMVSGGSGIELGTGQIIVWNRLASDAKWTIKKDIKENNIIWTVMILSHSKPNNMQFIAGGEEKKIKM